MQGDPIRVTARFSYSFPDMPNRPAEAQSAMATGSPAQRPGDGPYRAQPGALPFPNARTGVGPLESHTRSCHRRAGPRQSPGLVRRSSRKRPSPPNHRERPPRQASPRRSSTHHVYRFVNADERRATHATTGFQRPGTPPQRQKSCTSAERLTCSKSWKRGCRWPCGVQPRAPARRRRSA